MSRAPDRPLGSHLASNGISASLAAYPIALVDALATLDVAPHLVGHLVHRAALAVALGMGIGVVITAFERFAATHRRAASIGFALLAAALAFGPASRFSGSERLAELGADPRAVVAATMLLEGIGLALLAVAHHHREKRVIRAGLVAVAAAFAFGFTKIPGTYADLQTIGAIGAILSLGSALEPTIRTHVRRAFRVAAVAAGIAIVGGAIAHTDLSEARRETRIARALGGRLDVAISPTDPVALRAARIDVDRVDPRSCRASPRRDHGDALRPGRNALLITIDALRRDVVGLRVGGRSVTPELDALAGRALVPREGHSGYAATMFSLGSALTGASASRIVLSPKPIPTLLARTRADGGLATFVLPEATYFDRPAVRAFVTQGVPVVDVASTTDAVDAVLATIARARSEDRRFAIATHLSDPHHPYVAHPEHPFGDSDRGRYLSEVAAVDAEIGRLFRGLDAMHALDDTVVVVVADHGEALGERGHVGHHRFLNRWITEVPYFVFAPGRTGQRLDARARIVDIAETLSSADRSTRTASSGRDLTARRIPDAPVVSEAFSTASAALVAIARAPVRDLDDLRDRVDAFNDGFAGYPPLVALVDARYRLIVGRRDGVTELYDRIADPDETHDLSASRPDVRRRMLAALAEWTRSESIAIRCDFERER